MSICFLAFGSNLGDRRKNIQDALSILGEHPKIDIKKVSSIIETEPVGGPPQGKFLNAVARLDTTLDVRELLDFTRKTEKRLGRKRTVKNGPRTIDLDILLFDDKHLKRSDLEIPHPKMLERDFVMKPLNEIAPGLIKGLKK